ncbi:MAG TPA: SMP-30/gluconolactonase/LRE family protein [Pseudomonadales bacterium]|jgi:sugar lactone lactonase YvrE|nr:SMP-30/gluconolactonase/LRE family protein [Pseudomonadales bacterium]MDP6317052.1 SMP-30/gluconolactonase/LRE family protein [Pseudomonadales bacterium]MDP7316227.1 SMP-30/gluconolactonase/LRE family protein [Pseudomonadales bacterium]MDP7577078.1 SMP-30/gluconolactonase/LRE family protein [Pseudomonadales bacterium]HJL60524.1 SMP-30/gluconolactonase/LRE family protein [Pseudomonadales bacterium]|tara:strand:+ start:324 stop:1193 length:870 start_codon:yes stop_codon:yes gene_type:complete
MVEIERIADIKNQLGEGPLWDSSSGNLFWVDSLKGEINCLDADGKIESWLMPCMIGSLAIVNDHRAVVALLSGLHFFDFETSELTLIADPESDVSETRFNDGKTDRAGNFLAGTMGIKVRDRALGSLYRIDANQNIEILEPDVVVANGPCFSPDGATFYFNDGRRRILAYDYDPAGPLKNKREFFNGANHETGSDGATVDADGNIWVALTGSSEVGCLSTTGKLLERISMPINLPSSVMFGGQNLDELYVTSISNSGNRTSEEEGAGGLYRVRGLGAVGLPEKRYQTNS